MHSKGNPTAQARRHVYAKLAMWLEGVVRDDHDHDWLFADVTDDADRRRLARAARSVVVKLLRLAAPHESRRKL